MNLKNINMTLQQATEVSEQTLQAAQGHGMKTRAYVAVAFDCPFEGATPLERVVSLAVRMLKAGAHEVVIADTIGSASPGMVRERTRALRQDIPVEQLAMHFHDTRGMAVANAWAAVEEGYGALTPALAVLEAAPLRPVRLAMPPPKIWC